ncbi:hypothetical protein CesoFtcFv8_027539 [Champsocephalus esox]|uniref:Uncharacterized protein n=2 Tax=Champsocephalus TaxID=52236 RepID=A0AAN8GUF9_CHAGU|nr:hypothetical protein CesoFtcFv8_027539 [Champsocephalus esox]KAK5891233.1 hypothetical protein CgunFtcFv8_018507 [Champsocephalus gunnari]
MFLQLHNHKLSPWERLERWIGRDKEWVREERQQRQEEKGKERKPRDPAEAPKTKQEKAWEAAALLPSLPTVQR